MKEINVVLKSLSDGLKAIAKSMEAVAKQVDALTTSKPKPKTAKKTPVKKATSSRKPAARKVAPKGKVVKKTPVRAAKKAPAAKRVTAVDTILSMISRSKKGVSVATLKDKTKFNDKKIANIVYKLKNRGKSKVPQKDYM
jgi:uncharacterized protein YoxC